MGYDCISSWSLLIFLFHIHTGVQRVLCVVWPWDLSNPYVFPTGYVRCTCVHRTGPCECLTGMLTFVRKPTVTKCDWPYRAGTDFEVLYGALILPLTLKWLLDSWPFILLNKDARLAFVYKNLKLLCRFVGKIVSVQRSLIGCIFRNGAQEQLELSTAYFEEQTVCHIWWNALRIYRRTIT